MDRTRLELEPGLWLDAAGAAYLAPWRALLVADLHIGYAWAHRAAGQLLPIEAREDTTERLGRLVERYAPDEVFILGDIVHRAVEAPALHAELRALTQAIGARARLRLIGGNHDRELDQTLRRAGIPLGIAAAERLGPHLLVHGDETDDAVAAELLQECANLGGRIILGHEHPAVQLSDGIASSAKCPCFLAGPQILVLPAFSRWAAGCAIYRRPFLSPYPRLQSAECAIAIVAGKLLRIPLRR